MESDVCLMLLADCVTPCERENNPTNTFLFFFWLGRCQRPYRLFEYTHTHSHTHCEYSLSVFADIRSEKLPAIVLQAGAIVAAFSRGPCWASAFRDRGKTSVGCRKLYLTARPTPDGVGRTGQGTFSLQAACLGVVSGLSRKLFIIFQHVRGMWHVAYRKILSRTRVV